LSRFFFEAVKRFLVFEHAGDVQVFPVLHNCSWSFHFSTS
jgi:hypothetical protein